MYVRHYYGFVKDRSTLFIFLPVKPYLHFMECKHTQKIYRIAFLFMCAMVWVCMSLKQKQLLHALFLTMNNTKYQIVIA